MKVMKIAGIVLLALWMVFLTYEIERIAKASDTACAYASAAFRVALRKPNPDVIIFCPTALTPLW